MGSLSLDPATLAGQLERLVDNLQGQIGALEAEARRKLSEAARKLSWALEAPGDSVHRIVHSPLQLPLTVVGVETKLFEALSQIKGSTITNAELASKTKVDPVFLKRLLRYYQSFGMVSQPGDDAYAANNVTEALTTLGGRAGTQFYLGTLVPPFNALPQFLRENGYQNIKDNSNCPWYLGHATKEHPFEWVGTHPPQLELFMGWMQSQRDGLPTFLDVVDFEQEFAQGSDDSTTVFVDIGGSMGHQCIALKQKCPNLAGHVVLQDQSGVIEQVKNSPMPEFVGIEAQSYDFFTPQPIKGARAYYLRNILHDWPADKCIEILHNIKVSMTEGSKILIDEMVLPERGTSWRAAQLDLAMASCFGAMERTNAEWATLLGEAGLQIVKIWKYTEQLNDCIIVAVPK